MKGPFLTQKKFKASHLYVGARYVIKDNKGGLKGG
jgi:hypothetical protein